ncbi:hypothetical protein Kosp01_21240 [Kocuria sp. NBRC 114282]|nr:hypothetical protein Kosp01_21240 [Kocuria sp. NBRC 114282]
MDMPISSTRAAARAAILGDPDMRELLFADGAERTKQTAARSAYAVGGRLWRGLFGRMRVHRIADGAATTARP